ncbi:DMT family transporter [Deferribacter autotrophicus]|uniref:DMT family transporter n=1 Tax=Deferribacter autotrophicus TaxID=500465 RepID=A0A5A8F2J6_9BACT|nr:DMT family transporter [Deferribacter autotrophicus]KAA0258345.1 DMT family transporter [Deferribacter autotrophicus]
MLKVYFILLFGIISVSFAAIFVRFCDDVPAIMIATYRLVIASVILNVIYFRKGKKRFQFRKKDFVYGFLGGGFLTLHFIAWFQSLKYTSVASSVVLLSTGPIFVAILSYLILKEKQEKEIIIAIIFAIIGTAVLAFGDTNFEIRFGEKALIGDSFAIMAAFFVSLYLLIGSRLREKMDIMSYIVLVYTFAAIILLVTSLILRIPFTGYEPKSYVFMVLLAVVSQNLGHTAFNWALRYLKTSMVAITTLGEPVIASVLAYFIFGESIDKYKFIGIILIFAAIIIASRKGKK